VTIAEAGAKRRLSGSPPVAQDVAWVLERIAASIVPTVLRKEDAGGADGVVGLESILLAIAANLIQSGF
jgi:hypothetical protein